MWCRRATRGHKDTRTRGAEREESSLGYIHNRNVCYTGKKEKKKGEAHTDRIKKGEAHTDRIDSKAQSTWRYAPGKWVGAQENWVHARAIWVQIQAEWVCAWTKWVHVQANGVCVRTKWMGDKNGEDVVE